MLKKDELTEDDKNRIVKDSIENFNEHVNPGWLTYRKSDRGGRNSVIPLNCRNFDTFNSVDISWDIMYLSENRDDRGPLDDSFRPGANWQKQLRDLAHDRVKSTVVKIPQFQGS